MTLSEKGLLWIKRNEEGSNVVSIIELPSSDSKSPDRFAWPQDCF